MTCRQCQRLLSPYLDNVLPPAERDGMRAHLTQCAACTERLRQYEGNRQLLRVLPTAEVSRAMELLLHSQIQRLESKVHNAKAKASSLKPQAWWPRWGMISVGTLATASLLFYLSTMHTPPPVSAEEVSESMNELIKALDGSDQLRIMYEETEEEALPDWQEDLDQWPAGDGRDLRRW